MRNQYSDEDNISRGLALASPPPHPVPHSGTCFPITPKTYVLVEMGRFGGRLMITLDTTIVLSTPGNATSVTVAAQGIKHVIHRNRNAGSKFSACVCVCVCQCVCMCARRRVCVRARVHGTAYHGFTYTQQLHMQVFFSQSR